jgi:hypothetical protein
MIGENGAARVRQRNMRGRKVKITSPNKRLLPEIECPTVVIPG